MADETVTPIRRKATPVRVPYLDEKRDCRDCIVVEALNAAIQLIEDDDADHIRLRQAVAVIRLARENLDISWTGEAEIDAGVVRG
jgi:hypothetical protein